MTPGPLDIYINRTKITSLISNHRLIIGNKKRSMAVEEGTGELMLEGEKTISSVCFQASKSTVGKAR